MGGPGSHDTLSRRPVQTGAGPDRKDGGPLGTPDGRQIPSQSRPASDRGVQERHSLRRRTYPSQTPHGTGRYPRGQTPLYTDRMGVSTDAPVPYGPPVVKARSSGPTGVTRPQTPVAPVPVAETRVVPPQVVGPVPVRRSVHLSGTPGLSLPPRPEGTPDVSTRPQDPVRGGTSGS